MTKADLLSFAPLLVGGFALWFVAHMLLERIPSLTERRERRLLRREGVHLPEHVNEWRAEVRDDLSLVRLLNSDPRRTNPLDPGSRSEGDR